MKTTSDRPRVYIYGNTRFGKRKLSFREALFNVPAEIARNFWRILVFDSAIVVDHIFDNRKPRVPWNGGVVVDFVYHLATDCGHRRVVPGWFLHDSDAKFQLVVEILAEG